MNNFDIIDILNNISIVPVDENLTWKDGRKYQSAIFLKTNTLLTFDLIDKLVNLLNCLEDET